MEVLTANTRQGHAKTDEWGIKGIATPIFQYLVFTEYWITLQH
jgi:hypothetical protein